MAGNPTTRNADGLNETPVSFAAPLPVTPVVAGAAASLSNAFPVIARLPPSIEITGTFTPGSTSYTVNQPIGATGANVALLSLDLVGAGIPAGTRARINRVQLNLVFGSAPAAVAALFGNFFLAAPSVNITDGTVPALVAADAANVRTTISMTANSFNATVIALGGAAGYGFTVPAGGLKFYFSSSGVQTWTTNTPGVFTWIVEVVY